jgi:DNA-binding NarL/FixJ family response regulator
VNVLIVDDHESFRASARRMLELDGYDVVGEAGDGASALALARQLEPDVVLLDIGLPDVSGFEVAEALATVASPPTVVLISNRGHADVGSRPQRSSAHGFIPKEELSPEALRGLLNRTG